MASSEYRVSWHIELDAENERDAAEQCWERYFRHGHIASSFEVTRRDDPLKTRVDKIDMHDPSAELTYFVFSPEALHAMACRVRDDGGDLDEIIDMLEKPNKWREVLTEAILHSAPGTTIIRPETPDLLDD